MNVRSSPVSAADVLQAVIMPVDVEVDAVCLNSVLNYHIWTAFMVLWFWKLNQCGSLWVTLRTGRSSCKISAVSPCWLTLLNLPFRRWFLLFCFDLDPYFAKNAALLTPIHFDAQKQTRQKIRHTPLPTNQETVPKSDVTTGDPANPQSEHPTTLLPRAMNRKSK
jgi:hypothetical protein